MGKNTHYGKSMSTNILGSPILMLMGFVGCCIFTRWKSNVKTHPFHGKSMGNNFPDLYHLMSFADLTFLMYGDFDEKTHVFPMG